MIKIETGTEEMSTSSKENDNFLPNQENFSIKRDSYCKPMFRIQSMNSSLEKVKNFRPTDLTKIQPNRFQLKSRDKKLTNQSCRKSTNI